VSCKHTAACISSNMHKNTFCVAIAGSPVPSAHISSQEEEELHQSSQMRLIRRNTSTRIEHPSTNLETVINVSYDQKKVGLPNKSTQSPGPKRKPRRIVTREGRRGVQVTGIKCGECWRGPSEHIDPCTLRICKFFTMGQDPRTAKQSRDFKWPGLPHGQLPSAQEAGRDSSLLPPYIFLFVSERLCGCVCVLCVFCISRLPPSPACLHVCVSLLVCTCALWCVCVCVVCVSVCPPLPPSPANVQFCVVQPTQFMATSPCLSVGRYFLRCPQVHRSCNVADIC
jgi:hypothetical protein